MTVFRVYCTVCAEYYSVEGVDAPTTCPVCGSTLDSKNVVAQQPCLCGASSDETMWDMFIDNDGSIITAKRK